MKNDPKTQCKGSGTTQFDVRYDDRGTLVKCKLCGRVATTTSGGKLRAHQVAGPTTASHDKTMDSRWAYAREREFEHFAIGLSVYVRPGQVPAGWGDIADPFDWDDDDYASRYMIQSVDEGGERPTYEVMGWFWYPEHLVVSH